MLLLVILQLKLGQKAVVYMPKGSTQTHLENIQKEQAIATIEDVNYDECVRIATLGATQTLNGVVIQDTDWDILRNHVDTFISAPDWIAAKGMRMLAAPLKGYPSIISGESGAVPFGVLAYIVLLEEYQELRNHLGLNKESKILLFSTEGDTDPKRYKSIVWDSKDKEHSF